MKTIIHLTLFPVLIFWVYAETPPEDPKKEQPINIHERIGVDPPRHRIPPPEPVAIPEKYKTEKSPGMFLESIKANPNHASATATVRFINPSNQTCTFYGYSLKSPFYSKQMKTEAGWKTEQLGWCGTGAGNHTIGPGQSTAFEFYVPKDVTLKYVVSFQLDLEKVKEPAQAKSIQLTTPELSMPESS